MRKLIIIVCLFFSFSSFGQFDSIYARLEITSVSMQEHRTWIDTSIILTLDKIGRTEIISLGTIDDLEIGFQWELLQSRFGDKEFLVSGKAYYIRKDGKWEMHYRPTYQSPEFTIVTEKPTKMPFTFGSSSTTMQGLAVEYREHYYVIR